MQIRNDCYKEKMTKTDSVLGTFFKIIIVVTKWVTFG
jgi:hypothetical protein